MRLKEAGMEAKKWENLANAFLRFVQKYPPKGFNPCTIASLGIAGRFDEMVKILDSWVPAKFVVGDSVVVPDPESINEVYTHSFIGTVKQVKNDVVTVTDQHGDCFDIDIKRLEASNG